MPDAPFRDPQSPRDGGRGEATVAQLVRVVRRWRRSFYSLALGLPVITAVVLLLTPNKFTSTGTILVETPEGGVVSSALLAQFSSVTGIAPQGSPSDMYLAILRSDRVRTAVADSLRLADYYDVSGDSPAERLEKTLTRMAKRTSMDSPDQVTIHVAATDEDPQKAADIVNGFLHELDRASQTLALSRARRTRRLVENSLTEAKTDLDSIRAQYQRFQEKYGVFEIEKQTEGALDLIGNLQAELVQAQTERRSLASYASESSSQMRVLDLKIAALQDEIQKLVGGITVVAKQGEGTGGKTAAPREDPIFVPLNQLPELAGRYARLLMDLKVQESKYNVLATQLEQTKIEESQSIPAFEILDWGTRPFKKSGPFRTLYTLAALVAGLMSGLLFVLLLEDLDRRMSAETRRELLGLIPGVFRRPLVRLAGRFGPREAGTDPRS
jgi:uncharacterized protein involved in exopolysaccharide biosynthesis